MAKIQISYKKGEGNTTEITQKKERSVQNVRERRSSNC
jgi:hypothetical protein